MYVAENAAAAAKAAEKKVRGLTPIYIYIYILYTYLYAYYIRIIYIYIYIYINNYNIVYI